MVPAPSARHTMVSNVAMIVMVRTTAASNGTTFMRSPIVIFIALAVTWK